jgi:hypothetical protein
MNDVKLLEQLGRQARAASAPRLDVVAPVMQQIRRARPERPTILWAAAGLTSVMAIAAAIFALQLLAQWQDPLNQWFTTFDTVLR